MVKLNQNIIKTRSLITIATVLISLQLQAQQHRTYNALSFYVIAHQDDWQLFMGANVFNDINAFNEITPASNGTKVVIIYTTAGNLNDSDDTRSCNCKDILNPEGGPFPYWKVREEGSKRSVHLAACRMGGWGPGIPYPQNKTVTINGHSITKYEFKNTVSYYLRIKAGNFGQWHYNPDANVGTIDTSATYTNWTDFVNTIYYIYKAEMDSSITTNNVHFNYQDFNETINPNDHSDHYIAGKAAYEAAKILGTEMDTCFQQSLFVDYNSQNLPANLTAPDVQNESAVTAVYCLALLDYNAWPEWGSLYQDWTSRNYFRTITTCEDPTPVNVFAQDSLDSLNIRVYPSPADKYMTILFNLPLNSPVRISIIDIRGATVFNYSGMLTSNTFPVYTGNFQNGSYMAIVSAGGARLSETYFEVMH